MAPNAELKVGALLRRHSRTGGLANSLFPNSKITKEFMAQPIRYWIYLFDNQI